MEDELKRQIIWLWKGVVKLLIFTNYQSREGLDGKSFLGHYKEEFEWLQQNDNLTWTKGHQETSSIGKADSQEPVIRLDK